MSDATEFTSAIIATIEDPVKSVDAHALVDYLNNQVSDHLLYVF